MIGVMSAVNELLDTVVGLLSLPKNPYTYSPIHHKIRSLVVAHFRKSIRLSPVPPSKTDASAAVRPSVNVCFARRDTSVLREWISIKLGTNIHHVSGQCWKGFQGQRSKVTAKARPNALLQRRQFYAWRRSSFVLKVFFSACLLVLTKCYYSQ